MVLGAAVSEHRLGPLALASGLAGSFVAIGLFPATIGFSLGIDSDHVRVLTAIILVAVGLLLIVPSWQTRFALLAGRSGTWPTNGLGTLRLRVCKGSSPSAFSSASSGVLALGPLLASPRCWRPAGRAWGKSPLSWGPLVRAQLYLFSFLAFSPERPWRGGGAVSLASV